MDQKPVNNNPTMGNLIEFIASIAALLVPLIVYVNTIAPTVSAGDSGEFISALNSFSMVHPPGYPLYMILLKIWRTIPINVGFDPVVFKTNLFSAVCMSFAVWLFYKSARILTNSLPAALGAALILAFSRTFWKFAVVTEVYALHCLLITIMLYGLVMAREKKIGWGVIIAVLAFGLGIAHHFTIMLLLPLMIFLLPKGEDSPAYSKWLVPVVFILPLLFYTALPSMAANTPPWNDPNISFRYADFWKILTRADFIFRADEYANSGMRLVQPMDIFWRIASYITKQFGWLLPIWAVVGFFLPSGKKKAWGIISLATIIIWIGTFMFFSKGSPLGMPYVYLRAVDEMVVPLNIFFCLGMAFGFAPLSNMLSATKDFSGTEDIKFISKPNTMIAVTFLFCVVAFFVGWTNSKYSDFTHHTWAQDQARNVLEQVPLNGVLVVSGDESFIYDYLQNVRGIRGDVETLVYPFKKVTGDEESNYELPPSESLADYINNQLFDRPCLFSFNPPAEILPMLRVPRSLRLDGVAQTLVVREEGMENFFIGDPNIWTNYQLRNLDPPTLGKLSIDDFEYEVFDRYVNGLRASVAKLVDDGYGQDPSVESLTMMADELERNRNQSDYPVAGE
jgi:hypothetical protein